VQLNLSENRIDKGEGFEGHQKLINLNLRKNRLANIAFIKDMPNLVELYLVIWIQGENNDKFSE